MTIAVNHDRAAILMHKTNHPYTEHIQASVWDVDPVEVCAGRPVELAWFSPDCKHFSKAKGSALVDRNVRGLAWIVLRWAGTVRPRVIVLENVEEFVTWGPVRKGKPVKKKAGETFQKWKKQLCELGYQVEHRELVAADYGAPTTRRRLVLIARCDGLPIVWPKRTHARADTDDVVCGRLNPWRSAAEVIDWKLPMYSIFDSKEEIKSKYGVNAVRPLAENTLRRIIRGVDKYTLKGEPYIVNLNAVNLISYHTETSGEARANGLRAPMPTQDASNRYGLVAAHLTQYFGSADDVKITEPMRTITTRDREGLIAAHIAKYEPMADTGRWPLVRELLNKHCGYDLADNEILVIRYDGADWFIRDISMRMLAPRELYNAMGFPPDYIIDRDYMGKPYPRQQQVARCGNAVCPPMARAVVAANLPEYSVEGIDTMERFRSVAV